MLHRIGCLGVLLVSFVGCAVPALDEESGSSANRLSGTVEVGTIVTTKTDGLRLRKLPTKDNQDNVIGLLPLDTRVKVLETTPMGGFYKVDVLDAKVRDALLADQGWVFGEHLTGQEAEPAAVAPVREPSTTGTHDVDTVMQVRFRVVESCSALRDDQGKAMAPSIDDVLERGAARAVLGIDTNTFSYGMTASIDELDAPSSFNPGGVKIPLKIVKTARTQSPGLSTITLCSAAAVSMLLPANDGTLTLHVHPY